MIVGAILWFIGAVSFFSIFYYIFLWPARKLFVRAGIITDTSDADIDSRMRNGEEFAMWAIQKTIMIGLVIIACGMFYFTIGIMWMLTFYGRWNLPAWPGLGPG